MICRKCKKPMVKVARYIELDEADYELTEGQEADYLAALESGDTSEWDYGVVEYECKQCGSKISEMNDNVKSYDGLIRMWHEKAKQGDYFSRFVFEYIAFNAYLKSRIVLEMVSDRTAIQRLKRNKGLKVNYLKLTEKNKELNGLWKKLIGELNRQPLLNSSRNIDSPEMDKWWNCSEDDPTRAKKGTKGIVRSLKDWENMVEFWYSVRNNLFHGGKNPDVQRDHFLVEHAFRTLESFMRIELSLLGDDLKIF